VHRVRINNISRALQRTFGHASKYYQHYAVMYRDFIVMLAYLFQENKSNGDGAKGKENQCVQIMLVCPSGTKL
jgi:hypothetical protein